jgi:hypothetical protein
MKRKDEDLGICENVHPFRAVYRRQRRDDAEKTAPTYCPWCDWRALRGGLPDRPDPWTNGAEWRALRAREREQRAQPV